MARTADLGWCMARCDGQDLELMEPESADSPAKSLTIASRPSLITLYELLKDALDDETQRDELTHE